MDQYNDDKSGSCFTEDIATKLENLQSLISHAKVIEEDGEALVRSLNEQYVNPQGYQISSSLENNLKILREILANSYDLHFRECTITSISRKAAVIFIEGMANIDLINTHIIGKLMLPPVAGLCPPQHKDVIAYLQNTLLTTALFSEVNMIDQAVMRLLSGETILIVDGVQSLIVIDSRKMESRAISEPETESNVHAPRDSFIEGLITNVSLLRRRVKNANLTVKKITLGERSHTEFALIYLRGITNQRLVYEAEQRLNKIKIDAPVSIGFIQGLMEDHQYSPFPTMLTTERPDKLAAALLEGKVGIIMDGVPFALVVPATLPDFFQTGDDYNEKWAVASLIRLTRYLTALFAMATPAFFIAITTFHPGLIPTPLAITIAVSRIGVPFPAFIEALIMETLLEVLQEAGVRLPKPIGPAVAIVGGLVIGEATVRAGFASAPMVIIIALTAIASYNIANYRLNLIVRLLRVPLMSLGASLGMLGVMLGLLAIMAHLSMIESFGVPYWAPVIPKNASYLSDLKDTVVVVPPSHMDKRPMYLTPEDKIRQEDSEQ